MRIRPWAIGLFLIVGFTLFTGVLFLIGNRQKAFSRHVELYTEFSNVGGLPNGAKVRVSGFDAGKVRKIDIPEGASGKFRLELQIEEKVHGMVRKDSVVSIETEGVVGDTFVSIKKGTDQSAEAPAGSTLPSKEPLDLAELLDKGSLLLADVHGSVKDIRGRVDVALDSLTRTVNHTDNLIAGVQPNINHIASNGSRITGKIDSLVTDLNAGKGPAGMLLKDEATKQQLQSTLSNVQRTSTNLEQASVRANQTIADFQSRELAAKAQATLENVQAVSQQLNVTLKDALAQDNMGEDGAANLRRTLSNLNRSTTNLAEDTEALKHNFFFRGFFKKRGFYDLDQLTPAEYLEAADRQKNSGSRIWLQASSLFTSDATGHQQLTETGRQQIDAHVAPVIDALPGQLVVVEGYAVNGSPDQQFVTARSRADLVRHYLEAHFHLRHSDIGIVALRDKPPQNAGRDTWDGAAVALPEMKANK
jgi:phospholipid/cholesterol/gamma-HCH transport system substrate-binding protein